MNFIAYMRQVWQGALPGQLIRAILVAALFELLVWLVNGYLERRMRPILLRDAGDPPAVRVQRRRLILRVPALLVRGVLYTVAVLIMLRIFRMNTAAELLPLGLALVVVALVTFWRPLRDMAEGYLLLCDHLYTRGDRVVLAGYEGKVLDQRLRWTELQADSGAEVIIPHSKVGEVINLTRGAKLSAPAGEASAETAGPGGEHSG